MMMLMLGFTRSILRCSDAVAMRSCKDSSIRPIRISRIGGDQIVHDGIPLILHCIPIERNRFRYYESVPVFSGETASDGRFVMPRLISIRQTVDRFTIGRCRAPVRENMVPSFGEIGGAV